MNRFDGTTARQLDLMESEYDQVEAPRPRQPRPTRSLRLLRKDTYAELARRRRRAQIRARHELDRN